MVGYWERFPSYQYMTIFFNFSPTSNHLHPLQVENCDSDSRLVVDEDDNCKFRLERVNQMSDQMNSTRIAKIFCDRCLVNLIIKCWRRIFFQKNIYFSSFGAGNCVSNSSFKWMKNIPKQFDSIMVNCSITSIGWTSPVCWDTTPDSRHADV